MERKARAEGPIEKEEVRQLSLTEVGPKQVSRSITDFKGCKCQGESNVETSPERVLVSQRFRPRICGGGERRINSSADSP